MRNFENKEKIVQVSGGLKIVSFLMMLFLGYTIIYAPVVAWFLQTRHPIEHLTKLLAANAIGCAMAFMVWWNFWNFFKRLKEGHLFDPLTVKRLANAGRWKIAVWAYLFIPLWLENSLAVHADGLFAGCGIIFTAWLLREGQTLEEDQKLTV